MVDPAHLTDRHSQSTMNEESCLVPEGQRQAGVDGDTVDQVHGNIIHGNGGLPTWTVGYVKLVHIWNLQHREHDSKLKKIYQFI